MSIAIRALLGRIMQTVYGMGQDAARRIVRATRWVEDNMLRPETNRKRRAAGDPDQLGIVTGIASYDAATGATWLKVKPPRSLSNPLDYDTNDETTPPVLVFGWYSTAVKKYHYVIYGAVVVPAGEPSDLVVKSCLYAFRQDRLPFPNGADTVDMIQPTVSPMNFPLCLVAPTPDP